MLLSICYGEGCNVSADYEHNHNQDPRHVGLNAHTALSTYAAAMKSFGTLFLSLLFGYPEFRNAGFPANISHIN